MFLLSHRHSYLRGPPTANRANETTFSSYLQGIYDEYGVCVYVCGKERRTTVRTGPKERSTDSLGSFLIPPTSVHSYTPTLKLIGSLSILSSKSETKKLIDLSER